MKTKDSKNQNVEIIKGKASFVFYRSFFEAIETLSTKNRLIAYEAIVKYGLNKEETMDLPLRVLAILKMAIPNMNANHEKYCKRMKATSQTNQKNTSDAFEEECADEVLLPEEELKLSVNDVDGWDDDGGEFEP